MTPMPCFNATSIFLLLENRTPYLKDFFMHWPIRDAWIT